MRVEVGRTIQLDVELKVGNVQESIVVTGESPVVDAVHSGITSNFNQEMLQNIPSARQSYFDIVTFTPAVKINQVPNDSRFIIFGSSSDQNQFQYDGVDISAVLERRRLGLPEPGHHAGSPGERDRSVGGVPQLPGRCRQHRDQVRE